MLKKLGLMVIPMAAITTVALAQVAEDPKREAAIRICIAEAQKLPGSADANDPQNTARVNAYAACMRRLNERP